LRAAVSFARLPLLFGDAQGFAIEFLSGLGMPLPQQQLAFVPVQPTQAFAVASNFAH